MEGVVPLTAFTEVGASGTPEGVTGALADAGPVPAALVAVTVTVYGVPLVKPVMVIGLADPLAVAPPGDAVAVYPVIALPPLSGAVNVTKT